MKHLMEPGIYPIDDNTCIMTKCCWHLSVAALWPNCSIPAGEQLAAQQLLKNFILQSQDPNKAYLEICQRVLLTRERMLKDNKFVISNLPCRFFSSIRKGYALSEKWYSNLLLQRIKNPLTKLPFRALAEAILEMAEDPTAANFHYWVNWFKLQEAWDEHLLFMLFNTYNIYKTVSYD